MKKIVSIILILCISIFALSGCKERKEISAEELIDSVIPNLENIESLYMECETNSSMSVLGSAIDIKSTVTGKMNIKDKVQYGAITMTAMDSTTQNEYYITENANGADVYINANGVWMKQTAINYDEVAKLGISTDYHSLMKMYFKQLKGNCKIDEITADGKDCYVLSGKIDMGKEILEKSVFGSTLQQLVQSGLTVEQIEEIISNVGDFDITIYVDKESLFPVQLDIDITDATQNIMMGLADILEEQIDVKVERNIAVSKYSRYNEIGEIVIPQEALNAQEVALY